MKKISLLLIILIAFLAVPATAFCSCVDLSWTLGGDADLAGYRIYYGIISRGSVTTPPDSYPFMVDAGYTNKATVCYLVPGTTYYFSLTSYDSWNNESGFADEVTAIAPAEAIPGIGDIRISGGAIMRAGALVR